MKSGTSNSSTSESKSKKTKGVSQDQLNRFYDQLAIARQENEGSAEMPCVEASPEICEHYNRNHMKGFQSAGYFVFGGVKVYEEGTMEEVQRREGVTIEDVMFGRSQVGIVPIGSQKKASAGNE